MKKFVKCSGVQHRSLQLWRDMDNHEICRLAAMEMEGGGRDQESRRRGVCGREDINGCTVF